jgi:hypothetical protein
LENRRPRVVRFNDNYFLPLPRGWAQNVTDNYGGDFEAQIINDRLIVTPSSLIQSPIVGEVQVGDIGEGMMRNLILAMYMKGYDSVMLKTIRTPYVAELITELSSHLYGFSFKRTSSREGIVTMSDAGFEQRFNALISRVTKFTMEMGVITADSFMSFPSMKNIKENYEEVKELEEELDRVSFYAKRLASKALIDPNILVTSGMNDPRNSTHLLTIISNVERVGDLNREMVRILRRLSINSKRPDKDMLMMSLAELYSSCNSLVVDACRAYHDQGKLERLLNAKKTFDEESGIETFDIISDQRQIEIKSLVQESQQAYEYMNLEGKIWALVGHATNIAEAVFNISSLTSSFQGTIQDKDESK